jgi:hypothetical protein
MLIWDPDLPMPSDDLFEVQEPPAEVLVVKTWSRGQPISNNLTMAQNSGGKLTPDHPKAHFVPRRNPINIHTRESPKMDYNIVEDLKKLIHQKKQPCLYGTLTYQCLTMTHLRFKNYPHKYWMWKHEVGVNLSQMNLLQHKIRKENQLPITWKNLLFPK